MAGVVVLLGGGSILAALMTGVFSFTTRPAVDLIYYTMFFELAVFVWLVGFSGFSPLGRLRGVWLLVAVQLSLPLVWYVEGFAGDGRPLLVFRWAPRPEPEFSKATVNEPVELASPADADYPGFRGRDRLGVVRGVQLAPDWESSPPELLWRRPVGAGWSAFAVAGEACITQEQRGEFEAVVCYDLQTGQQQWLHEDRAYLQEMMGGPGPRATPSIHQGHVYALGVTGILNCLDGATGNVLWQTNILEDAGLQNALFGMTGSPLVVDGKVIVAPGGKGTALAAYDADSGKRLWAAGEGAASYASPQLAEFAGGPQVLNFNAEGLYGHKLETGEVLWSFPWRTPPDYNNVCQPVPLPAGSAAERDRVFLSSAYGKGCALLEVSEQGGKWSATPRWHTTHLKAKFSSVVVRDGFVYGLDESILACVDLKTGRRKWKGGRYGYGQLILAGDLLLVQAESGQVVLVEATPEAHRELSRCDALSHRTWTHPALAGSYLLVRNDREAACYQLSLASGQQAAE